MGSINWKYILLFAALSLFLAVLGGAFAAHALKESLSEAQLASFQTGIRYQFYHGLAIFILYLLPLKKSNRLLKYGAIFFGIGITLFSGSIYLLATKDLTGVSTTLLGPITPIGGLFFLTGWALCFWAILKSKIR